MADQRHSTIGAAYRRFAEVEAARRSPVYADITERISEDARTLDYIAALPADKRQPNLLLGAVQYVCGPLTGWPSFRDALANHAGEIELVVRTHATQTNIPARCATLLPALAELPQPLALIEVGASAGLCLYPDRYGYRYEGQPPIEPPTPTAPVFSCRANPPTPIPVGPVHVTWRAGLDLNPLDIADPDALAWLDALVWPGEEHLRDQLHAAHRSSRRNHRV